MPKHGKRYREADAAIEPGVLYAPLDAMRLIKDHELSKFDATVEVHFRLGVNVRHADQQLRGTIALPHGTGREVTVAVFAEGDKAREAEAAGADVVGGADLAKRVQEGFTEFDVAIATPDMMGEVGKLGRVLGPAGKMPNPKTGTVTFDIAKAVSDVKGGKVEYRTDRTGIVHLGIGKRSFTAEQLVENYQTVLDEILRAKPAAAKGRYIKSIALTQTMGPGIPVDTTRTLNLLDEVAA
jgi:large subunit ribosomal protein L1